jgi:hypothetical protein
MSNKAKVILIEFRKGAEKLGDISGQQQRGWLNDRLGEYQMPIRFTINRCDAYP